MTPVSTINNTLWAIGLILQLLLLTLLFTRHLSSRLRRFTGLIAFFCLRSLLLFTLFHHLSATSYAGLYSILSVLDTLLQLAIALDLARHIPLSGKNPLLRRSTLIAVLAALSALLTAALVAVLPAHSPAPVDRGTVFTALLFVQIFVWYRLSPRHSTKDSTRRPATDSTRRLGGLRRRLDPRAGGQMYRRLAWQRPCLLLMVVRQRHHLPRCPLDLDRDLQTPCNRPLHHRRSRCRQTPGRRQAHLAAL